MPRYTEEERKESLKLSSEEMGFDGIDDPEVFRRMVFKQAMSGRNVQYAKLWAEMMGLVKQKEGIKIELSADQIHDAVFGARGAGIQDIRMGQVQGGCELLREPLRGDTGPGEGGGAVRDVASSDGPAGCSEDAQPGSNSES